MPRDGSNVYTQPFPDVAPSTTVASAVYNGFTHDVAQDLNTPRPIVAGGTGANNADTALFNLSAAKAAQVVTNYDAHLWIPGSFYSATTASGEPVDGHAFSGIAYIGEALANPPTNLNVTIEARDATDGKLYTRRKVAGVWGSWILDGDLSGVNAAIALKVDKAGDTMTGMLVLPATTPTLGTHATNKTYVDAADTALAAANTTQDTAINNRVRHDAAQGLSTAQQTQARVNISAPLRSWLTGLVLSTAGSSATFGVAAGEAADSTNVMLIQLVSAYTKTTATWAVGSAAGSLDTGAIANNTWYHVYLIRRPDTGVVDVAISTSASTPTLGGTIPAAYTQYRRIGSVRTNASAQWLRFFQLGDEFLWSVPTLDINAANISNAAPELRVLPVPLGVQVNAFGVFYITSATLNAQVMLSSPDAPLSANVPVGLMALNVPVANTFVATSFNVRTNTASQIAAQSNFASTSLGLSVTGWVDRRGRDA
jgi:hypothetical protein